MALLFSAVTVTAGEDEIELLVGGIPREYDDLEGWSEFDDLMCFISEETEVSVRAEAYLYGEGESMRATPEEIDDLMQRIKDDSGFLNRCCSNLESVNFTFVWSPEMNLYLYVDGRGRMTIPSALRCRTGMGKNSFVRARLYGSVVQLTHVTPREAAQMTEEELLDFIRASVPRLSAEGAKRVMRELLEEAYAEAQDAAEY